MSDLISRQAAIDALEEQLDYLQMLNKDENPTAESQWYGVNWARNTIADLPSAQPEIIRCKDCKWFRKEYGWNCIEYTVCGISPSYHPIRREEDFCSRAERRTDDLQ